MKDFKREICFGWLDSKLRLCNIMIYIFVDLCMKFCNIVCEEDMMVFLIITFLDDENCIFYFISIFFNKKICFIFFLGQFSK